MLGGAPTAWNIPQAGGFSIEGGSSLTPEFIAVLLGLTLYTASYVAEVVRAGIASVPRGQGEAASALGLSKGQQMRLVSLPQALRVIIPPMTNQYLNLTKNSSLAVAIGYPDVVSIANTAINQTGRAVECIVDHHAGVPDDLAGHVGADELVQQARGDQGALSMRIRHRSSRSRRARRRCAPKARCPGSSATCSATCRARWRPSSWWRLAVVVAAPAVNWALLKAVFAPSFEACQAARGVGACWGVVTEKYRLILFGRYPFEDQWRPLIATCRDGGGAGGQLRARLLEALAGAAVGGDAGAVLRA